jgi:hypothetical protein
VAAVPLGGAVRGSLCRSRPAFLLGAIAWIIPFALIGGGSPKTHPVAFRVAATSFTVFVDFALTFVPSALAFTTRSLRGALQIGFAMIRRTWPRCALYVLCPPIALNVYNFAFPTDLPVLRLVVVAVLAAIALLARGATAAFYLREQSVSSDDGAAHIQRSTTTSRTV